MTIGDATRSVSKVAAFAAAAALLALLSILGTWAAQSYFATVNRAQERAMASAKIVSSHVSWIHQMGVQTGRRIDDALRLTDLRFDGNIRDMDVATQGLPERVQAYVVDAAGRTLFSTDPEIKPINIMDRDYFTAVRDGQTEYVSSLLISRLNAIQDNIVAVNDHMQAIASSAREQATGLSEVNSAVNQMDQVTQQNAAMVEESNAASATLATETQRLRQFISRFTLGRHYTGQSGSTSASHGSAGDRPSAKPLSAPRRAPARPAPTHGNAALKQDEWQEF